MTTELENEIDQLKAELKILENVRDELDDLKSMFSNYRKMHLELMEKLNELTREY